MTNEKLSALGSQREPKRSLFSARKLVLMASVVTGLCLAGNGFSSSPGSFIFGTAAHAQASNAVSGVGQPTGFADLVDLVKPSVISVKVTIKEKAVDADNKIDDGSDSPMERFFRRFGGPEGMPQNPGREGRHGEMMGQGSGSFISSDGYAVTNNHVVDGADKVEVTTDAGKTYSAKVIGTDPRTASP
jgi:serine protease Do